METDPKVIREKYSEILRKSGFSILDIREHHFQPQGYTALWLLSESHFATHTFPEFMKSYIELSSCNLDFYLKFLEMNEKGN